MNQLPVDLFTCNITILLSTILYYPYLHNGCHTRSQQYPSWWSTYYTTRELQSPAKRKSACSSTHSRIPALIYGKHRTTFRLKTCKHRKWNNKFNEHRGHNNKTSAGCTRIAESTESTESPESTEPTTSACCYEGSKGPNQAGWCA